MKPLINKYELCKDCLIIATCNRSCQKIDRLLIKWRSVVGSFMTPEFLTKRFNKSMKCAVCDNTEYVTGIQTEFPDGLIITYIKFKCTYCKVCFRYDTKDGFRRTFINQQSEAYDFNPDNCVGGPTGFANSDNIADKFEKHCKVIKAINPELNHSGKVHLIKAGTGGKSSLI